MEVENALKSWEVKAPGGNINIFLEQDKRSGHFHVISEQEGLGEKVWVDLSKTGVLKRWLNYRLNLLWMANEYDELGASGEDLEQVASEICEMLGIE